MTECQHFASTMQFLCGSISHKIIRKLLQYLSLHGMTSGGLRTGMTPKDIDRINTQIELRWNYGDRNYGAGITVTGAISPK
jgi:hypothetical protein